MSDRHDSTRKEFLIAAGASVAAGAMLGSASALGAGPGKAEDTETQGAIEQIPPHRELATPLCRQAELSCG